MGSSNTLKTDYKVQLKKNLTRKEALLKEAFEKRKELCAKRENFDTLQAEINSLTVDIDTIKGRIENIGKAKYIPDLIINI